MWNDEASPSAKGCWPWEIQVVQQHCCTHCLHQKFCTRAKLSWSVLHPGFSKYWQSVVWLVVTADKEGFCQHDTLVCQGAQQCDVAVVPRCFFSYELHLKLNCQFHVACKTFVLILKFVFFTEFVTQNFVLCTLNQMKYQPRDKAEVACLSSELCLRLLQACGQHGKLQLGLRGAAWVRCITPCYCLKLASRWQRTVITWPSG